MTDQHPITPPLELVQKWIKEPQYITEDQLGKRMNLISMNEIKFREIIDKISQYSADQELIECLRYASDNGLSITRMRTARRPEPQTPADGEVAELVEWLQDCANVRNDECYTSAGYQYFRAAELLKRYALPIPETTND